MNFIQNVFVKIAGLLGLKLQDKNLLVDVEEIEITRAMAKKVSTLSLMDSKISISGTSSKAVQFDDILKNYLQERIETACEVALVTGDAILKPYTDGENIAVDVISNTNFVVCESIGNKIKSIIIKCEEIKINNTIYARYEAQKIRTINGKNYLYINQFAFKDDTQVPLQTVEAWQNLKEEQIIPNVDNLLLGKIKCPTVDKNNPNSINGVKITHGSDKIIKNVIEAYNRFNKEFRDKETLIFASKNMLEKRERNGNVEYVLPKDKKNVFQLLKGTGDNNFIETFDPAFRDVSLDNAITLNLRFLEMACSLSSGILTAPTTNFATATEMKASLQSTFAYMTRFRKNIELGVEQLFYAMSIISNVNSNSEGNYQLNFDWSSAYIEQLTEQFNRIMQGYHIGAVSKAQVRAFITDEDLETAKKEVEEIQAEQPQFIE